MQNDCRDDSQKDMPHADGGENLKGENVYDKQGQNFEESRQADSQEPCGEGKTDDGQEKRDAKKTCDLREEGQGFSDELPPKKEADPVNPQSASVFYTPPYYVPNVTVGRPGAWEQDKESKKGKRKFSPWLIAICALVSVVVSFGVGSFAGYVGAAMANERLFGTLNSGTATLVQNNGSITIQEILESDTDVYTEVYSVVDAVADSVVEISTSQTQTHPFYGQYVTSGAGSGVILAQTATTGIIVTNYHVIEGATSVTVRLTNGTEYAASYRGGDASMDIAVLYIALQNGETLNCAKLGDSEKLVVGQRVVAIGNPLGKLGGTVTDGIVSALDRKISIDDNVMTLLQTNTAINPGNSGGGLFDMAGRLVGIVNAKQSAEGIEGLGFAIPINVIEEAIASITEHGYVQNRPTLGVEVTYVEQSFQYAEGVYVARKLREDTPLDVSDRILSINGTNIGSKLEYNAIVGSLEIGTTVRVEIERGRSRRTETVTVTENTQRW